MAQYAKKRAKKFGIPYIPTARSKMRLTPSEQSIIAFLFRKAKQAFDETQNKPDRGDNFYVTREHGASHYLISQARCLP
jgi:hypothetical protein